MNKQIQFVVFWIIMCYFMFLGLNQNKFSKKNQKIVSIFIIVLFIYIYSFRTLGLDLRNYIQYYSTVNINNLLERFSTRKFFIGDFEPLFDLTILFAKKIGFSVQIWLFTIVLFPTLIFYFCFIRISDNPLIMMYYFIIIMMFQIDLTRFYLASPFICLAFFSKSSYKKLILYLIAFGFHYSALFMIVIELLCTFRLSSNRKFLFVILIVICSTILKNIDLSSFENSQYKFIFKIWYYLCYPGSKIKSVNIYHQIMTYIINVYPTIISIYLYFRLKRNINKIAYDKQKCISKYIDALFYTIIINIILITIFGIVKIAFRIILLIYFMAFFPITYISHDDIGDFTIHGEAIGYTLILFNYDIFMSLYYVLISILY